jgi:plasmid stabilization system protein ParE
MDEADLRTLNSAVVDQLKLLRNRDAAVNRRIFKAGDHVKWSGRRGEQIGTIIRVKRKKAIVSVHDSARPGNWDVPLGMLSAA